MPEKTRRATASRYQEEEDDFMADGFVARLVDRACENPAMSGGLFVMALTATAIVSNAMFLQNARHPQPLFSTRPATEEVRPAPPPVSAAPHALEAPLPPDRDEIAAAIAPPVPRPAPITITPPEPAPVPVATAAPAVDPNEALLRDIQTELADRGLYLGAIDGKYGALSRTAIAGYEKAAGLPVTGEPSPALLAHMRQPAAVAAAPPSAPPAQPVADVAAQRAELERLRYQKIQMALNRIGYGPVPTDGAANTETADAIRRFELDNGLPISGAANEKVMERLVAIGALPAT